MKQTRFHQVVLVGLLILIMVVAGVMGYALTMNSKIKPIGDQAVAPTQTLLRLLTRPFQNLGKSDQKQPGELTQTEKGIPQAYVVSYGTANGRESLLVKGKILSWGDTWVEVESQDGENFPLLLPEKTLKLRCLPATVMMNGVATDTRGVYVDMTKSVYQGKTYSSYTAPTILPVGSQVLVYVEKDLKTNEVYPKVVAGYGCEIGERDPLENIGR